MIRGDQPKSFDQGIVAMMVGHDVHRSQVLADSFTPATPTFCQNR
jgi:hypothetical protein